MVERGYDRQVKVPTWNPPLVMDEAPLLTNASINDFQHEKARYVANAVKQALLLPRDMANLRSMKKHKSKEGTCPGKSFTWFSFT